MSPSPSSSYLSPPPLPSRPARFLSSLSSLFFLSLFLLFYTLDLVVFLYLPDFFGLLWELKGREIGYCDVLRVVFLCRVMSKSLKTIFVSLVVRREERGKGDVGEGKGERDRVRVFGNQSFLYTGMYNNSLCAYDQRKEDIIIN